LLSAGTSLRGETGDGGSPVARPVSNAVRINTVMIFAFIGNQAACNARSRGSLTDSLFVIPCFPFGFVSSEILTRNALELLDRHVQRLAIYHHLRIGFV